MLRENLYGFTGNQKSPYIKISVYDPKSISRLRGLIERGDANYEVMWPAGDGGIMTFDNIQYVMRFMVDTKMSGMSWVEVPASKYSLLGIHDRASTCQVEASVHFRDLIPHPSEGEYRLLILLRDTARASRLSEMCSARTLAR